MTDDDPEVSDQVLARRLASVARRIEQDTQERDQLILALWNRGWSQGRISRPSGLTQQGVSKVLKRLASGETPPTE